MAYLSASDWVSHKAGNRLLASVAVISRLGLVWGDLLPCPLTQSLTSSCACLLLDWKHQILATWPLYRPIQNMAFFGTKAGVGGSQRRCALGTRERAWPVPALLWVQ